MLSNSHRRERIQRWSNYPPTFMERVPEDKRNYMIQAVQQEGKRQLADTRIAEMTAIVSRKPSPESKNLAKFSVMVLGALTFSLAPTLLAQQSGRGAFAISVGLIGGVAGGFVGHELGTVVLTGWRLKQRTEQARKSIAHQKANS